MFDKLKKAFGGSDEPKAPKAEEKVEAAAPVETKAPEEPKAASAKPRIGYIPLSGCTGDAMSLTENYDILSTVLTDMMISFTDKL
jgi:coenzyme F420 hydrogenase subunit gamma